MVTRVSPLPNDDEIAPPQSKGWHDFHGPNAAYVLDLYDRYSLDPSKVDAATRAYFEAWTPVDRTPISPTPRSDLVVAGVHLAHAVRRYGHLAAHLDPLGSEPPGDPALEASNYALGEEDLRRLPASVVGGPVAERSSNAFEAIEALREVYSSTLGFDYYHVRVPEERAWLRHAAESGRFRPGSGDFDPLGLLDRLSEVEVFERFLQAVFPGKTRFSIEGLDVMVPVLDEVVGEAAESGIFTILLGMAHRGRLSVLAHVLKKPYAQILAEFKDPIAGRDPGTRGDLGWTGDVKYHLGASRAVRDGRPVSLVVCMVPNPSHLEHVNPVIEGMARAAGTRVDGGGTPRFDPRVSLPVLIHGDMSFPGQGVVSETLNLSRLPGYSTGGTIHIIANNQLGFTTEPREGRSTLYASDLAKGFKIPIIHVNADDPEAAIEAARTAAAYRTKFHKDFLIDIIGYRRWGHNEGDEPRFTQPTLYAAIDAHPTVRSLWARKLEERGVLEAGRAEEMCEHHRRVLEETMRSLEPAEALVEPLPQPPPPGAAKKVKTSVPADRLQALYHAILEVPPDFLVHPKLQRILERRRPVLESQDSPVIDWALAETLAFASILEDGTAIRLSGEDVERGTFSHRHAAYRDAATGTLHVPLQAIPQAKAAFELVNSPLSECAALGFEYGYNAQCPDRLVIWEAQYGDFINVAQAMVDEFLTSARAKWGQTPSLVLLLPHGYEGQGPDHSSARPERFLGLAAEINLRIANCTTPGQYFHLLRRQAALLATDPLPLVILSPKSLLRHPTALSTLRELAEGAWQPVFDDPERRQTPERVKRLILVSGKVYLDLVASALRREHPEVAIVRVEQLYPVPVANLEEVVAGYPACEEVVWLQEEPENMGAWPYLAPKLRAFVRGRMPLGFLGRRASSSPAEGSLAWHAQNQERLVASAFERPAASDRALETRALDK